MNDVLSLDHWSFRPSGVRKFEAQGHKIQVHIAVNLKEAKGQAFVNGNLVAEDLFADFNAKLGSRRSPSSTPGFAKVALWVVMLFVVFAAIKYMESRPNHSSQATQSSSAGLIT